MNFVYYEESESYARNFVVTCLWDSDGLESEDECLSSVEMRVYQAQYGYCFTFDPPHNTTHVDGFSSILYIDDSVEVAMPLYAIKPYRAFATGAVLTAHQKKTLPLIEDGIILPAGMSSEVGISVSRREKLPPPFSTCAYEPQLPVSENYAYTQETCNQLCSQNEIIQDCGCVDNFLLAVPSQFQDDVHYCRKIEKEQDILRSIVHTSLCIDTQSHYRHMCDDFCPIECIENRYELTRSEIEWPHPTSQIAFYNAYILGKPYEERFQAYANLSASLVRGNRMPHLYDVLKKETLMKDNFLEVSITKCLYTTQTLFASSGILRDYKPFYSFKRDAEWQYPQERFIMK